jgi:hypothetical protein
MIFGYISYFNLIDYYFANYNHWVLHYIVDCYIDFDHLVYYNLTTILALVQLASLLILHSLLQFLLRVNSHSLFY